MTAALLPYLPIVRTFVVLGNVVPSLRGRLIQRIEAGLRSEDWTVLVARAKVACRSEASVAPLESQADLATPRIHLSKAEIAGCGGSVGNGPIVLKKSFFR